MRISTTQIFQTGIDQIQRNQSEMNRTSLQLGSGERILRPSDDPSGATQTNQFERIISATEQYQRNIDNAQPRLKQQESLLQSGTDALQRARELVVAGNNDSQTDETRRYQANELRQLRDELFEIANTRDPNGEYIFAGTNSLEQPFKQDGEGTVRYEGAQGTGSVREVEISPTRSVPVGDTGADVFMNVAENDGRATAEVANRENDSSLVIDKAEVYDVRELDREEYTIEFAENADGEMAYSVRDADGNTVDGPDGEPLDGQPFVSGESIDFAGRSVTLSGDPQAGDEVLSRPAGNKDIFSTLDDIIGALEDGTGTRENRASLATATNTALADLDASLENFNETRADVGSRLKTMDDQTELNEDRLLDLETAASDIRDLDYAEAISRFNQQQVALQAAQQTYSETSRLSLFDFI
ncbi:MULTISPECIES: flagellar hook-associated protein FlgL [unclassified Thioalkalivibrio]|uniref:flagellar hook-associated protein FlgL n=1 Tax=unclassified Thioalkalivibrio TaxID=2621013 RepID=UPI000374084D|nr:MULTISPECIES: flagellar hook-associated protein FlgL [unclassified Thioalkalivibrio]PYG00817.1 flagellar hook-associated protein 3 FlgL [Thioalkalivibrio sp. ALE21]